MSWRLASASAAEPWILIPAKAGPEAKLRLSEVVSADDRTRLMATLLNRALDAVAAAGEYRVAVVARDGPAAAVARLRGVPVLPDDGLGPNLAVAEASQWCERHGAQIVAVIAADLPLVDRAAVVALLRMAQPSRLVIAPDRLGQGTNALVIPAGEFPFAFGRSSFAAHCDAAAVRGWSIQPVRTPGLAVDLDEPGDLDLVNGFAKAYAAPYNRRSAPLHAPEKT